MDREKAFTENMDLVGIVCWTRFRSVIDEYMNDIEDMYQEGYIALWNATKKFNKDKGKSFRNYSYYCIYDAIRTFCRKKIFKLNNIEPFKNEQNYLKLSCNDDYSEIEVKNILECISSELNERHIKVIKLTVLGYSQRQIGEILNINHIRINKDVKYIREILKKIYNLNEVKKKTTEEVKKEVNKMYEEGYTYNQIAYKLGIGYKKVFQCIENKNRLIKRTKEEREEVKLKVIEDRKKGYTYQQLASKYNISTITINQLVNI